MEFSPDKSHQENVKIAIDKIIGQSTNFKKRKKSEADHKRIMFKKIIEKIIEAEERSTMIDEVFSIDFNKYNNIFFEIIEEFLNYSFNKDQIKIINFYLYDRYNADGTMSELRDNNDEPIKLDTADDLWYLIKKIENE